MNGRERVTRAIEFRYPDRLPLRYASDPERSDYINLRVSPPPGWTPAAHGLDEWGCLWQQHPVTSLGQVKGHPLGSWDDLATYQFPDAHAPGRFDEAIRQAERYRDRYLVGSVGLTGFDRLLFLRGFENLMVDLLTAPDRVVHLAERVMQYECDLVSIFARIGVQAVSFADDLGTEQGLMISPPLWRALFKPLYRRQFEHAHSLGLHVVFHSCGNIWDIMGDLIEIGVDVLNVEQPRIFGLDRLAAAYGGKVCFLTNPDSQRVLPVATPEEVEAETERVVEALSTAAGGLIGNADCTWDHGGTPSPNLEAMSRAFQRIRNRSRPTP